MIKATLGTANDTNGNGKYKPLRKVVKKQAEEKTQEFDYLSAMDSRMRFNSSKDPIYFAFECLEKRSISQLAGDLVKDSFFEISNFISKVVR